MRTTITLDDDVVRLLADLRKQSGGTFKDVVNRALRAGLRDLRRKPASPRGAPTDPVFLGQCRLDNLDNISDVLASAEGEGPLRATPKPRG